MKPQGAGAAPGWPAGALSGKLTVLRNSTNGRFWPATRSASPLILKNQTTPSRGIIAARMHARLPVSGWTPTAS